MIEVVTCHGTSLGELYSGSRRREIGEARAIVSAIAVRELGYSGAAALRRRPADLSNDKRTTKR